MRKSCKIKQLVAASAVTFTLFAAVPNVASAGPLVCVGAASAAALGWLGTTPVVIWTAPATVPAKPPTNDYGPVCPTPLDFFVEVYFVAAAYPAPTP